MVSEETGARTPNWDFSLNNLQEVFIFHNDSLRDWTAKLIEIDICWTFRLENFPKSKINLKYSKVMSNCLADLRALKDKEIQLWLKKNHNFSSFPLVFLQSLLCTSFDFFIFTLFEALWSKCRQQKKEFMERVRTLDCKIDCAWGA